MSGYSHTEHVTLGKTAIKVTPLGVGTWAWGDRITWGYGRDYTDADLEAAYKVSLKAGVNFFDTAEVYGRGRSERLLSQFMHLHAPENGGPVVIATKFMPYPWRLWRGRLVSALQGSLQRLGLDKVDLHQIHWPWPPVAIETWVNGLADAVEAGLTRAVGVSNYNLEQMRRAHETLAKRGIPLASNQVDYSLLRRKPEHTGLLDACRDLGVALIAYSPLGMGLLTGKYTPDNPPTGPRGYRLGRKLVAGCQPLLDLMRTIGQAHGDKTPAQVALNWCICKGTVPIPGAKNAEQARQNAGALGWRLTDNQVTALDRASNEISR